MVTDFSVTYGHRPPDVQLKLFQKGREFKNGKWTIVRQDEVVTYCDGFDKLSRHNAKESEAVDLVPYPIDWNNKRRFYYLAGAFMAMAYRLEIAEVIESRFQWGGHWKNFVDLPHYQIKKS